jgi:hypothetical protein
MQLTLAVVEQVELDRVVILTYLVALEEEALLAQTVVSAMHLLVQEEA